MIFTVAESEPVKAFLRQAKHLIVIDHLENAWASKAEVASPAGTFAEADGTLVNSEGRGQRFFQIMSPTEEIQQSRQWLTEIMAALGRPVADKLKTLEI